MNLIVKKDEELENLPRNQKIKKGLDWWNDYNHEDYPWRRVHRFLRSRVGKNFENVLSEFVKLKWILPKYRTLRQLADYHIETNTFIRKGEVFFYNKYCFGGKSETNVKEHYSELFYVHPKTHILCFQPKSKKINWKERHEAEEAKTFRNLGNYHQLLKLGGIWYEVKGQPMDKSCKPDKRIIGHNSQDYVMVTYKKQLNNKELKKFNLTNDPIRLTQNK